MPGSAGSACSKPHSASFDRRLRTYSLSSAFPRESPLHTLTAKHRGTGSILHKPNHTHTVPTSNSWLGVLPIPQLVTKPGPSGLLLAARFLKKPAPSPCSLCGDYTKYKHIKYQQNTKWTNLNPSAAHLQNPKANLPLYTCQDSTVALALLRAASRDFNATKLLAKHTGATPIDLDACDQILPAQAKGLSKAGGCQCWTVPHRINVET